MALLRAHTNLPGLRAPLSNPLVQLRSRTEINLRTALNFTRSKQKVGEKREHFADHRSRLALDFLVVKKKKRRETEIHGKHSQFKSIQLKF